MTDLRKIDFMQLKLEPVASSDVTSAQFGAVLAVYLGGVIAALKHFDEWQLSTHAAGLNRAQTDELWKRTEQVDEFIRQQSRRRITLLKLIQELVNEDRVIKVFNCGQEVSYRFNRSRCSLEYQLDSRKGWETSVGLGRHDEIVTIID